MKKIIINLLLIIQSISFLITTIIFIIFYNCFDLSFYEKFYKKEKIYEQLNTSYTELFDNTKNLLNYLKTDIPLNEQWFSKTDIAHMVDVKNLYLTFSFIMNLTLYIFIALTILLIIILKKEFIKKYVTFFNKTLLAITSAIIILAIIITINFEKFWITFHETLFSNDLWLLDPASSNLIQMVPENFFTTLITKIIIQSLALLCSLFILNIIIKKKINNKKI